MPDSSSPGIFLSYRREDAAPYARLLQRELRERFPGAQVFMDLDSIEAGLPFAEVIREAVGSCAVLVALIGRQWVTIADAKGNRRIDDPGDYVRFEVQTAVERGVRVIPVLFDGAGPPRQEQLPSGLRKLAELNALELSYGRYEYDAGRLLDLIERVLASIRDREETDRQAQEEADRQAQEEAQRKARQEAEEKARQEAEEKARLEAVYGAAETHSRVDQDATSILPPGRGLEADGPQTPDVRGDGRRISRRLMVIVTAAVAVIGLITAVVFIPGSVPSKPKAPAATGQTSPRTATSSTTAGPVTASLPVVICPTSLAIAGSAHPLPRSRRVAVPRPLAAQLSVYADNQGIMELLAPKGWSCTAAYGVDGGGGVRVYPHGEGPSPAVAITGSETSACTGCTLDQACGLFPSAATALHPQACPAQPPAAERRVPIAAGIVAFEDPPGVKGTGQPSGGQYAANGVMTYHPAANDGSWQVTCTLPSSEKDVCTEVLNTFVSWYGQR